MEHMDEMVTKKYLKETIRKAMERFGALIREDFKLIEAMKQAPGRKDFKKLDHITVGILPGDGIGPYIMEQALRVAKYLLQEEVASGKVEFRTIPGMTIEERAKKNESLPAEVLEAWQKPATAVLVKGPFVTPRAGDPWPNLVSANSLLRRALQLYAAVRPVRIPEKGIDWTFFRENIEGEYIWGNKGIQVNDDLAVDFKVLTRPGAERICRAAFEFAKNNGKTNDRGHQGQHRETGGRELPEDRPCPGKGISRDHRPGGTGGCHGRQDHGSGIHQRDGGVPAAQPVRGYRDGCSGGIPGRPGHRQQFQHRGPVRLFEAIHGVGNFLVQHHRAQYADPCSLIRAMGEMISHIGYAEKKERLAKALTSAPGQNGK